MNYNYFDTIDTEEKAYWLGFYLQMVIYLYHHILQKEGKIKNGRYKISLELKAEDIEHLKSLQKLLIMKKK